MSKRTKKQDEANKLDMELYRLIGRIERFFEDHPGEVQGTLCADMYSGRAWIRMHMHKEDLENTK